MRQIIAAAFGAFFVTACASAPPAPETQSMREDPYLWLEEIEGERALAWVREQNARSLAVLEADPRFAQLHTDALAIANNRDRLPLGGVEGGYYYNFWQDETHVRGIWRRASITSFTSGAPQWQTMLDVDALAAAESANWVFKGADCFQNRCMIALSDGGRDAVEWREFDLSMRTFVAGGFVVPTAKSSVAWQDADTLLVATDWGEGSMTESGYAYIVKRWARGTPLSEAVEVMRGQPSDVAVFVTVLEDTDGSRLPMAIEAETFFETTSWRLDGANPQRISLPAKATVQGLFRGNLVFTLEEAWNGLPQGALAAYPLSETAAPAPRAQSLFAPGPRQSIEGVAITRDAVLIAGFENVRGRLLRVTLENGAWRQSALDLPTTGSIGFAGTSPTESAAFATYEDFTTPTTLYALEGAATAARAIRSLAPLFDASRYVTEQFEAVSADGARVPY
ncbi:MAG TPA: S9 family peptidase, partial [Terricaulis sp.]|nr:S9 family peptidase [Terricaulis sp.]